jgi:hypothetical protein
MVAGLPRTMKKIIAAGVVITLGALGLLQESFPQNSASATVSFRLAPAMSLSVLGTNPQGNSVVSVYTIPRPTEQERQAGFIERLHALTLQARSNAPWALRVRAYEPSMGTSDDGTYRKPVSDFEVRAAPGPYLPLSVNDQTVTRGPSGEHIIVLDYRVQLGPQHRDGTYSVTLIYTITTP